MRNCGELVVVDKNNSIAKVKASRWARSCLKLESPSLSLISWFNQVISLLKRIVSSVENYRRPIPPPKETHLLYYIWPDDVGERIRLNNVNRLLRRDTLSMGQDVIYSGDCPPFLYDQDGKALTSEF